MVGATTIFAARKIITMNPSQAVATAVAVRDGRILSVGSLESLQPWLKGNQVRVIETFKDKVILPGFIDNHIHPLLAAMLLPMALALLG